MDPNESEDLERLREQLRSLESLRGVLDEAIIAQNKAALEARLRALVDTGSGAFVGGNVDTRGGPFAGRDQWNIDIRFGAYKGEAPRNEAEVRAIYLRVLASRCGDIPLSGLDRDADDASNRYRPLGLERVFVNLDTQTPVSAKIIQKALASGQPPKPSNRNPERPEDSRPLAAWEAAVLHRRSVLLGAPGSCKSTLVNRLCLALAHNEWKDLEGWPERERQRLPVLVILRDFARWLEGRDTDRRAEACPALFCDYLRHDLERRKLDFAWPLLSAALDWGAQVFLDGLDEVPPARRPIVLATIEAFAQRYGDRNWLLVTCRVASYQRAEWQLPADRFVSFELAPFTDDQIKDFVSAWYREMAERWNEPQERTRELAARLQEAMHKPDLRRLARNPLLLTVMALVHTHDKVLPDHRAVLYERTIAILLWRWETHKRKEDAGGEPELLAALRAAGCTETDLLVELRRLAFDAHAQGGETDDPEQVEGIGDGVLVKALARLHREQSWDWARSLVELMRQRTGLLVEREPGVFAFPHRTFQEYLAGVHLALSPN